MNMVMKLRILVIICVLAIVFAGCASLREVGKKLWGSSTEALEKRKGTGQTETFRCSFSDCFDASLSVLEEMGAAVFKKDRKAGLIVAINFEGAIYTTEVGIFFQALNSKTLKIEIISLNDHLQESAAADIFSKLKSIF